MKKMQSTIFMIGMILLMTLNLVLVGCSNAVQPATDSQTQSPADESTNTDSTVDVAVPSTKPAEVEAQETAAQLIADGTYVDEVTYRSPGGVETFEMSISVEGDVITAASITVIEAGPKSTNFINGVNGALTELVVGKDISTLDIPKQVAGSSLTTAAFKAQLASFVDEY